MNAQDLLGSQLLDLALDRVQVRPQLVALENVLHHHRLKAWSNNRARRRQKQFLSENLPRETDHVCERNRPDGSLGVTVTCCDHGLEARLLVDPRPNDVSRLGSPMSEGQEAQGQAHSRRHGNYEAAGHAPDT